MKAFLLIVSFLTVSAFGGGDINAPILQEKQTEETALYRANEIQSDTFASLVTSKPHTFFADGPGGGQGINYFPSLNWGFGIEANFWDGGAPHSQTGPYFLTQVSASVFYRYPIGPVAPYVFAGSDAEFIGPIVNAVHGGAGCEFRINPTIGIFADARYMLTTVAQNLIEYRAGLRMAF